MGRLLSWSCWADSNCRPHPYQGCALPTELQQQSSCPPKGACLATEKGLEPSTSGVTGRRSNRLNHSATAQLVYQMKNDLSTTFLPNAAIFFSVPLFDRGRSVIFRPARRDRPPDRPGRDKGPDPRGVPLRAPRTARRPSCAARDTAARRPGSRRPGRGSRWFPRRSGLPRRGRRSRAGRSRPSRRTW